MITKFLRNIMCHTPLHFGMIDKDYLVKTLDNGKPKIRYICTNCGEKTGTESLKY